MISRLEKDFEEIYISLADILPQLQGKRLLLTGGTGFFGKWILGFFHYAQVKRGLRLDVWVLSRAPDRFLNQFPEFDSPQIHWVSGDVREFQFSETIDFVIHGATEASASLNDQKPLEMFNVIVQGTRNLLDVCVQARPKKILLLSSGAVYGAQPSDTTHQSDESFLAPDVHQVGNAYAEGKRVSELLGAFHHKMTGQEVSFARCFAFVGPYLPLDTHFAVGNFINDCLHGRPIVIKGDGTPHRSYMYASDLVTWLLRILVSGKNLRSYNVGSEESLSMVEIAQSVSRVWHRLKGEEISVEVLGVPDPKRGTQRYVPSVERARRELGLIVTHSLEQGLQKTLTWLTQSI